MSIPRQDKHGVRTAQQVEQKYKFGQSFAEVFGLAEEAQETAKQANKTAEEVRDNMTTEQIFNILTNNGEAQGIYRDEDGQIYINALYIAAGILSADRLDIEELFAKNINMTGKFTHTAQAYIPPGYPEIKTMQNHALGVATIPADKIPLYDISGDGEVTITDVVQANQMMLGTRAFSDWSGAQKSTVTVTIDLSAPEKAILISGTNMWGRVVEHYIGVQSVNAGRVSCDAVNAGAGSFMGDVSVTGNHSVGGKLSVSGAIELLGGIGSYGQVLTSNGGGNCSWRNLPNMSGLTPVTGSISQGSSSYVGDDYSAYVVLARPSSSSSLCSCIIPSGMTGYTWQVADEAYFTKFEYDGSYISVTGGAGYIVAVYGMG